MIIVCEPQCKEFSHEKFNSGFIHGLRLAYPQEKILLYADLSHIDAIKNILSKNAINVGDIEYIPIRFQLTGSMAAFARYHFLFKRIFIDVFAAGSDKLFLLSFSPAILYIIKKLKQKRKFKNIKFALVCHGPFEFIANDRGNQLSLQIREEGSFIQKIRNAKLTDLLPKITSKVTRLIIRHYQHMVEYIRDLFRLRFSIKKVLLWQPSADFKYILLGKHVIANVQKYIDIKDFNFHTIVLPTVFSEPTPRIRHEYVKFAVFGYGYPAILQKVLTCLSQKKINSLYEVRIIGMATGGLEGFANVTCPSPGKPLSREEMEKNALDIDMFLVLYDRALYKLTCSGSIIEALSYLKPILHFDNECISSFNKKENPIGVCCEGVESMAATMQDMINNYSSYVPKLEEYRKNMLELRKQIAIENNLQELKNSFTW